MRDTWASDIVELHHTRRMLTRAMVFCEFKFRVIRLGTCRFVTLSDNH